MKMLKFITLKKKKLRSRVIGACLDFASATRQASCFWFGWFTASWAWSSVVPAAPRALPTIPAAEMEDKRAMVNPMEIGLYSLLGPDDGLTRRTWTVCSFVPTLSL